MARSKREIPHYYVTTTVDMGTATAWLQDLNERRSVGDRILPAALMLKAVVRAAVQVPVMNGHWTDGSFVPHQGVDLGVAISLRAGGLVAPALVDADQLSVDEIMQRLRELVTRAREGVLRASEMVPPSITVTNLGEQGVESVLPVIYPPQVAMVGFGKIVDRPWAVDGMLAVRPLVVVSLAADHRANDGHDGARFLATVDRMLQDPAQL
jgi:pyruvate dehydrogenase E2 component (dihydrolipoamide acetyltransferase)